MKPSIPDTSWNRLRYRLYRFRNRVPARYGLWRQRLWLEGGR